jgi:hypothetical protein
LIHGWLPVVVQVIAAVVLLCAVSGRHDWPFAAQAFATALPWLAGRLGTLGVVRTPLPGLAPAS